VYEKTGEQTAGLALRRPDYPRQSWEKDHPGGNPGANFKSISHRSYLREVAFEWELTKETIVLPLGCIQGGWEEDLAPDDAEVRVLDVAGGGRAHLLGFRV